MFSIPHHKLALAGLGAALTCLASCSNDVQAADPWPPSLILISLDTLRADHMSLYGYERETTPYLERLAEECLVFDDARTVAPWTLISHMSMLTGLYPKQHGVVEPDLALSRDIPFLSERLSEGGYSTFGFYKPTFIGARHGHERGFDVFRKHVTAPEALATVESFLPQILRQTPSFIFLHLFDIHSAPYNPKKPFYYRPPGDYGTLFQADAYERLADLDLMGARKARIRLDDDQTEALRATYDGGIRFIDDQLAIAIETWRESGLLDDAVLIITADHGESLGQRDGLLRGHGAMYEEALHVPLLVRFPDGYRAGEREAGRVGIVDIVPTLLEAARIEPDERLPGQSLRQRPKQDRVFTSYRAPLTAYVRGPWKVIRREGNEPQLYHLENDPLELSPISDLEAANGTWNELESWLESDLASRPSLATPPIPAHPYDKGMRAQLEALGYAGDE